jgi:hypothetical protein
MTLHEVNEVKVDDDPEVNLEALLEIAKQHHLRARAIEVEFVVGEVRTRYRIELGEG